MAGGAGWVITWGERSWTDDDVLAADMATVQLILGDGWPNQDPWTGPLQLMAWITALEVRTAGRELAEVQIELAGSLGGELLGAIAPRVEAQVVQ